MNTIVIFGATSGIAKEVAKEFAKEKKELILIARDKKANKEYAKALEKEFGIKVITAEYDAADLESIPEIVKGLKKHKPSALFIAQGYMPNEYPNKISKEDIKKTKVINYESVKLICNQFADNFPKANFIAVISSVAGDVEKARTLHYGKSKSMLSNYLIEIRKKLKNTNVIDIKPGPTKTKMTANTKLPFGGASPVKVAKDIVNGINKKENTIYTPFYWKHIMKIVKIMPKRIRDKL